MSWRNLIWMSIVLCLAGFALYLSRRAPLPPRGPLARPDDRFEPAAEAYRLIRKHGYRVPPPDRAVRGAIDGILRQADEFSRYVPPEQVDRLRRRLKGTVEETGLRIAAEADALVVVGALPDSPAARAEVPAGTDILAINDRPADELTLAEARKMLQAPAGPSVVLRLGGGRFDQAELILPVEPFEIETVAGIARDSSGRWMHALDRRRRIFYIRIREFVDRRTAADFREAFRRLERPAGVVLDLRDNPGGSLKAASAVAECFLQRGLIVRVVPRSGRGESHYAHPNEVFGPVSLAVLINNGTASAAEVVAGALQLHGRAVLVGQPSYGKWCIQKAFDLGRGLGQVYLTTAEYFLTPPADEGPAPRPATRQAPRRPGKGPPERRRLLPDEPVRPWADLAHRLALLRLRAEVVLPARPPAATSPGEQAALRQSILAADVQLARAVELIRSERAPMTQPAVGTTESPRQP